MCRRSRGGTRRPPNRRRQNCELRENKCGPGQPPGPHCFRGMSCRPFPRTRHGGVHLSRALRRATRKRCHSADTSAKRRSAALSAALRWPTASPAVCGGLCEEAATPGQPVLRRNAFWRNPPGNSPSRIARNRRLCRNARQGTQNISLDGSTVLLERARFKQKSPRLCAETVNASVSLWKALEKRNEIDARLA